MKSPQDSMIWSFSLYPPEATTWLGLVQVAVMLTINGNELFWRVELRGAKTEILDRGDGASKLFPLIDIERAKTAALEFVNNRLSRTTDVRAFNDP